MLLHAFFKGSMYLQKVCLTTLKDFLPLMRLEDPSFRYFIKHYDLKLGECLLYLKTLGNQDPKKKKLAEIPRSMRVFRTTKGVP